ncbi:hypothetical protein Pcinc_006081 [Petrolisthes cinctipes]|uniref:Uncharacterized protein n=1 Tax=Petrolisthes cinctipes TaxID=88211 RepID=A0AAE1KZW6_PETCI|nr:hypothetical protein Pcinc_006081 [Petrolisthes cinctipes]
MIVEIDEGKFGKRKYNVSRIVEGQWVFGGICRQTRSFFMVLVPSRDKDTLLAVIKARIKPVLTLWIPHLWPTPTILKDWREVKRKVPLFGRRKKHFVGYLARSMFLMAYEEDKRCHHFLQEVAALYNPLQPPQT